MQPIKTPAAAKRVKWANPFSPVSWEYMRQMRENNTTREICDCNPYVEIYRMRDNVLALYTQNISGAADPWMFLILGSERAMLIDTACGLGDLQALAQELIGGRELIVVNTHHHSDHAWGNCSFDKIYCHEYLVRYLEMQNEYMWDSVLTADGSAWLQFDPADIVKFKKYEIVGVPDGYTWDLGGGHEVELIWTGGHAAGHAAFLDKGDRILFIGDAWSSNGCYCGMGGSPVDGELGKYMNIETVRDSYQKLAERLDEYDYVYPSHFVINLENTIVTDTLETAEAILKDPDDYDLKFSRGDSEHFSNVMKKYINGYSSLNYKDGGIYRSCD